MRTTLTLDDDLAQELQERSHRLRVPFKKVVNDAIRRGIHGSITARKSEPFRVEPHDCRLRPGFDDRRFNQLADELEVEAAVHRLATGR